MTLWDRKSVVYSSARQVLPLRWILQAELVNLQRLLSSAGLNPDFIVDVGTGSGDSLVVFSEGCRIVGLDSSVSMLRRTRIRYPGAALVRAAASCLPVSGDQIVFLSMIGLIEYIPDLSGLFQECYRVAKPSGHLLVTNARSGIFNRLRQFSGHRIVTRKLRDVTDVARKTGWLLLDSRQSLLQDQCLFQKEKN